MHGQRLEWPHKKRALIYKALVLKIASAAKYEFPIGSGKAESGLEAFPYSTKLISKKKIVVLILWLPERSINYLLPVLWMASVPLPSKLAIFDTL